MAPKKKATRKRTPVRKATRKPVRKPAAKKSRPAPPPPTIAGVFQLIYTKKGFLDKLLADMNGALETERCELPPADRDTLRTMLNTSYQVTGADALRVILDIMAQRIAPPPPPWPIAPLAIVSPVVS